MSTEQWCFFLSSFFVLFFFLIWADTHSLCTPSAEACLTGWPNAQPQGRDYQANLMVCVVCSCCATSPYREVCRAKGGIGSEETLCHDIYLPCSAYNHCFSGN